MFKKILIVNRGEIAVRIIKACREMQIVSAVIFSEADKNSLHVRAADEAYQLGSALASESYLNIPKIIELAKKINAEAIHPGYGFLSENAGFIKAVEDSGIKFIGPSSKAVELMGIKTSARELMIKNNVPVVPGSETVLNTYEEAEVACEKVGYPVMLKASAGGGGKGMRRVFEKDELKEAYNRAKNEALKAFGNDDVYIEKFIENPKHIEVQIIADEHGNYRHLFERECSIQRRNQKVIEESPSPSITNEIREQMTAAAINAAKSCGYYNAGTIEFLLDRNNTFYFLEMNTRLQVEHPVTEMITGIDLVKEQINIAFGNEISFSQEEIKINGHAIECRIYAEDSANNFAPSIGKILHHSLPSGPGIRVDRGIDLLSEVSLYYDPLLSKLAAWGKDRNEAIQRMSRSLKEYQIAGVITNIPFCLWVLKHKTFIDKSFTINFIDQEFIPNCASALNDEGSNEFEEISAIVASLLRHKENQFKPRSIEVSQNNKWTEDE
ncbi:MAG: acetyl-CoA carboxylase biotin carboxylase subunit [Bacteroidota bacterium]